MNYADTVDIDNYIVTPEEQRRRRKELKEKFYKHKFAPRPPRPKLPPPPPLTYIEKVRLTCPARPADFVRVVPGINRCRVAVMITADYFGLGADDVTSQCRKRKYIKARFVAAYIIRKVFQISYPMIGKQLGNRDHTSIMHAIKEIERKLEEGDEEIATAVSVIASDIVSAIDCQGEKSEAASK